MNNPYIAPGADLTQPPGDLTPYAPRFFAFSGRLGRARYVAYLMGATTLVTLLMAAIGIVIKLTVMAQVWLMVFMPMLMTIVTLIVCMVFVVRRLNDMNRTGWLSLLFIVPFVNLGLGLWLLFGPGSKGANKYGAPAHPNGPGVIAACVLAVLLVIFSAITSYGAYKVAQLGMSGNSPYAERSPLGRD